ncbi:MAG: hypothetical protein K6E22_08555 [Treponema sp.]|nr:hypothetical protein [Treponema sp.]
MKKITLVAGLLLSALVLFGATGCSSSGGGGGSDDDGVSYSSGSGSGSSSGGSGTRTYTSVAGGTYRYTTAAGTYMDLYFNSNGTFTWNGQSGTTQAGEWSLSGTNIDIYMSGTLVGTATTNSAYSQVVYIDNRTYVRR